MSPPAEGPADRPVAATFSARLSDVERARLLELGRTKSFLEGAALMIQEEYDERVMLLLAGRVKVTRTDGGEHELLLAIRDAGELIGELAFIDGMPRAASVTALEPVEALVMTARVFRAHLQTAPTVAVALLESVSARFRESTVKRLQFAASDTLGRLASRIVELADRYGEATDDGVAVAMPISQDELASWTGASRAGVAQGLQRLRELGWLSTERGRIVLHDPPALRDRAA